MFTSVTPAVNVVDFTGKKEKSKDHKPNHQKHIEMKLRMLLARVELCMIPMAKNENLMK